MVDFSKYQVKKTEDSKIQPGEKIVPGRKEIKPENLKPPKSNLMPKKPQIQSAQSIEMNMIDNKINEIVNDRILKLVKLGLKHELTIDNMLQYFREVKMAKLYELKRYFSDSSGYKIEKMLKFLYTSGELKRDRNNWYSLKR